MLTQRTRRSRLYAILLGLSAGCLAASPAAARNPGRPSPTATPPPAWDTALWGLDPANIVWGQCAPGDRNFVWAEFGVPDGREADGWLDEDPADEDLPDGCHRDDDDRSVKPEPARAGHGASSSGDAR